MTKQRADRLLVARGLFESRARAQAAIAAGRVIADGVPVRKPSEEISSTAAIAATPEHPYVSRGAIKLAAALDAFAFDARGRVCLDVGASTGGFAEMLLERGARCVYAVDVGRDQLHARQRRDRLHRGHRHSRARTVAVFRSAGFRHRRRQLHFAQARCAGGEKLLRERATLVALIKPQFEAPRRDNKKGIVRDPAVHTAICAEIASFLAARGWRIAATIPSPLTGGDGNREFLIGAERG